MKARDKWVLACMCILMATVAFLGVNLFLCGSGPHKSQSLTRLVYIVSDSPSTVPHVPNMRASRSRAIPARMTPQHESHRAVRVRPAPRLIATVTGRSAFSAQELRIRSCESGDGHGSYDYHAHNPASTASGAWQALRSTWNNYDGYSEAAAAPPSVQDAFARKVLDEQGTTPWAASAACWSHP